MPTHHKIDYIELNVTDLARSKSFFERAFGWTFIDYGPGYSGIQAMGEDEREMGGLALSENVIPGSTMVILYSKDLDASFARCKNADTNITKAPYDFPGGRRFELSDPDGNPLAVWTQFHL